MSKYKAGMLYILILSSIGLISFVVGANSTYSKSYQGNDYLYLPIIQISKGVSTTRLSVAPDGTEGDADSWHGSISVDGRYVVFASSASNLVNNNSGSYIGQIYIHDMQTGEINLVSVSSDGTPGNAKSYYPSVSADGRFVVFISQATNLVIGDTNTCGPFYFDPGECPDVFLHDRETGQTKRVSVASDGRQANGQSQDASVSSDGRFIVFHSEASNLIPNDINGGATDIFMYDRVKEQLSLVSVSSNGHQANGSSKSPSISADGRYIAFYSLANNLVAGDTNTCGDYTIPGECPDIFVHDRQTGQTIRVSVASDGTQGNGSSYMPSISADGRYVAFESNASNFVSNDSNNTDIFIHNLQTEETHLVSKNSNGVQANGYSWGSSISADGFHISFSSMASNLVPDDTNDLEDLFVHDMLTGQTRRVSVSTEGTQSNEGLFEFYLGQSIISGDGRLIVFSSWANNLVGNDTNFAADIFLRDRGASYE